MVVTTDAPVPRDVVDGVVDAGGFTGGRAITLWLFCLGWFRTRVMGGRLSMELWLRSLL
jgi:hypothetical protein